MKNLVCFLLVFLLLPVFLLLACNKALTPTGPDTGPWYYFDLTGYGETLGPGYFKVFSDSTWQKYAGIDTLMGTAYVSVISSDSTLSLYTTATFQYAGYQLSGQVPIIFDNPLPPLPAHWASDTAYGRTATFTYNGYFVEITDYYSLVDTDSVATPVGNFSPAAHMLDETYLSASNGGTGYGAQDIWLARGPGEIVSVQQGQPAVFFVYGYVNGRSWGGNAPVQRVASRHNLAPVARLNRLQAGSRTALLSAFAKGSSFYVRSR
jgi:hypothetical protein